SQLQRLFDRSDIPRLLSLGAVALLGSAAVVNLRARRVERDHPPKGLFATVDGVRIHYLTNGTGPPVVFLHGNGMTAEDMLVSGVVELTAKVGYRTLTIDRPGFGY